MTCATTKNPARAADLAAPAASLAVRRATEADLPALLTLADALVEWDRQFDPSLDPNYNRSADGVEWMREAMRDTDAAVFVAGGTPARAMLFGRLLPAEPWRATDGLLAELEMLCVTPDGRGGGIGKRLVETFAEWARERGARRLSVRVSAANVRALCFYRREFFQDYDTILERPL